MEQFDEFEFDRRDYLGKGMFAMVFKGRFIHKPDVPVAVKVIAKKDLPKVKNLLTKEITILRDLTSLKHENVVGLFKCSETSKEIYLVMEYCNGGELTEYLHEKSTLNEETIQHFIVQVARALETMNKRGIVHRDLKPHNILLCNNSGKQNPHFSDITVKLADFGFARFLNDGVMAATMCGSPLYMAPEVIMELPYDAKADLFSIGTVFYQCLTGKPPFIAQTPMQLKNFYARSRILTPNIPEWCSPNLRDLLIGLLQKESKDRISFEDFFHHPFLTSPLMTSPSKRILESAPILNNRIIIPQEEVPRKIESPHPVRRIVEPQTPRGIRKASNPFVGGSPGAPRAVKAVAPAMQESTDFTFLPPLPENRNVGKTNRLPTASITNSKPVPVPSQRKNYLKMEERLAASRKPKISTPPPMITPELTATKKEAGEKEHLRKTTLPDPNAEDIEKLTLPHPTFVICENGTRLSPGITSIKENEPPSENANYQKMDVSSASPELVESVNGNPISESPDKDSNSPNDPPKSQYDSLHSLESLNFSSDPDQQPSLPSSRLDTGSPIFHNPPPALDQEIVLGEEHKQILAKLRFVSELVDTLMHVAEQKDNPLASAMASRRQLLTTGTSTTNTSSPYRRAEQLVVYVRALHMLSSALLLAQTNVANHVLHPSVAVQQILNQLNDKYHQCLIRSQELASIGLPAQDPSMAVISAERIMYRHAIELCESAALDELFGNPHLCSQRYQTAYMMLHTLAEQVNCDQDKTVLTRYKLAVEKRLRILERQGFVAAIDS